MWPQAKGAAPTTARPPDDQHDHRQDTPADPLPPGFIDLGGGDLFGAGTADDMRAAAAWLRRHYPEHSADPPRGQIGPIFNMGHDLTRMLRLSQVMPELGRPEQAVALELADICMDATRRPPQNMNAGARVCEDLGIPIGTLGNILARMAARGLELRVPIGKDMHGRLVYAAKGHALDFLFPPLPPRAAKGPRNDGPLAQEPVDNQAETDSIGPRNDGPLESIDPRNDGALTAKGPRFEDQRSTESWTPTPVTPNSKEDARRVGDPIADKLPEDQDQLQDQERSVANSQNRRIHDGPDEIDLSAYPPVTGTTAGSPQTARGRGERAGGAVGPLSEPAHTAGPDAQTIPVASALPRLAAAGYRFRSDQELAADQARESRAAREAAERAEAAAR